MDACRDRVVSIAWKYLQRIVLLKDISSRQRRCCRCVQIRGWNHDELHHSGHGCDYRHLCRARFASETSLTALAHGRSAKVELVTPEHDSPHVRMVSTAATTALFQDIISSLYTY